jgi:hypothetical protein
MDQILREKFYETTVAELPKIPISNPQNLISIFVLLKVMQDMHSANMRRGTAFMQTTFLINSSQFAYICVQVIFLKQTLMDLGGPVFIAYTFLDFFVVFFTIIAILMQGSVANQTDHDFKDLLTRYKSDIIQARDLARLDSYYEIDGQIEVMIRQEDGTYILLRDHVVFKDISKFKDVNEKILNQLDNLEEKVEFVVEQLDFKLEYG